MGLDKHSERCSARWLYSYNNDAGGTEKENGQRHQGNIKNYCKSHFAMKSQFLDSGPLPKLLSTFFNSVVVRCVISANFGLRRKRGNRREGRAFVESLSVVGYTEVGSSILPLKGMICQLSSPTIKMIKETLGPFQLFCGCWRFWKCNCIVTGILWNRWALLLLQAFGMEFV